MVDKDRSKEELINELIQLRKLNLELEMCLKEKFINNIPSSHEIKSFQTILDTSPSPYLFEDISEYKRAEEVLRESDQLYRTMFENTEDGFVLVEPIFDESDNCVDIIILNVNEAWERKTALRTVDGILVKQINEFLSELKSNWYNTVGNVVKTGKSVNFEVHYQQKWYEVRTFSFKANQVGIIFSDITLHKKTEESLERSNQKINEILSSIQDDFYVLDHDWNFVFTSTQFTTRICKQPKYFVGKNIWTIFPKHIGTVYEKNLREAMDKRKISRFDLRGKYTDAYYRMAAFPSADGITVLGIDITQQKKVELALGESEERYRTLFEYMNEGFFLAEIICDISGKPIDYRYLTANFALNRFTGLKSEEIVGKTWCQIMVTPSTWMETFGRVALTGEPVTFEDFSVELNRYLFIRVYSPGQNQFACLIQDITDRKKLEEELKYQKGLFEAVIENMHDALAIYNSEGNIMFLNAEARMLYPHLDAQTSVRNTHNRFEYFDFEENIIPREKLPTCRVFMGEKIRGERIIIKRPDRLQFTEINATPIFNEENNLLSVVIVHRDISELIQNQREVKNKQDQLLSTEKSKNELLEISMKLKDEFLYLITHEFKTPMAVINLALQAIDSLCKGDMTERLGRYINTIKINTNRQLRLVNNLLDVTRINTGNIKIHRYNFDIVYVTRAIVNSVEIYARQKDVNLNFTSTFDKKEIYLDEEKFERIMLNLLSNALKFTPKGKCINVLLSVKKYKNKNYISVSVKDEGIGIPLDKQKKVFERFGQADTSLSRQAEGTGLGLHLVTLLVNALEGKITLESEIGKGSNFTVLLPAIKSLSLEEAAASSDLNDQFISGDSRIVQAVSIEFSDLYFD